MKIIIIDDDSFITSSLKTILEIDNDIQVVALGSDGKDALSLYQLHHPDLILMDIRMKEMSGLEATTQVLAHDINAKILLLTTFLDDEYIIQALRLGAKGYILKQDYESILPSIKAVYAGQSVFGDAITTKIPDLLTKKARFNYEAYAISDREFDIIKGVAKGWNNKEIATQLFLSEGTVRNYISIILEKLSLRDRTQLAVFYYQNK